MKPDKQTELLGLDLSEMMALAQGLQQPRYRARQLFEGVFRQRVSDLGQISTLPQDFCGRLSAQGWSVGQPQIDKKFVSHDGTCRYLIRLSDEQTVETVWMPEGDEGEAGDGTEAGKELERGTRNGRKRATICLSSQVGCAVDCQFCLTALLGVKRNLSAAEMVGQVAAVLNDHRVSPPEDRVNLVFMGMGEPFLNYASFIKAVRLLVEGVGIPESRMTVSTAGIVPRIYDLGKEPVRPKLAISLNASNDELRTRLMPINRKWNLQKLLAAARDFPLRPRERLTFEYVLLDGVNNLPQNAGEVVDLVRGMRAKVNLIAFNPGPGVSYNTPTEVSVLQFQSILMTAGIPTFIRRPRGRDIFAACGQLKRTVELTTNSAGEYQKC